MIRHQPMRVSDDPRVLAAFMRLQRRRLIALLLLRIQNAPGGVA